MSSVIDQSNPQAHPGVDLAANLALFLVERTGSCLGTWSGRLKATEQRALFGRFIGKGVIVIDGAAETICNRVKVCFGLDTDDRNVVKWRALRCDLAGRV